ncbi:head to tail connecting protein [Caudoviricetes sp.]|nr:head to tail connecting protein [Caudoviricetes sp.]UOF79113.1 head to tail connecting protein [Caudoviricetes sp.]
MSIIQDDSERIKFVSKGDGPLPKAHKVPLRDAVVENLLEKCQARNVGLKVQKMWRGHNANMAEYKQRMEKLQGWDEYIDDHEMLYDGESNLHIPMPIIVLKTFHARMYQALFSVDPPFSVRAMQEAYQDDVEMIYGLMQWSLSEWCNYYEGIEETAERWIWNWCAWGSSVLKLRWDRKFTRYMDVREVELKGPSEWRVIIDPETGSIEEVESPSILRTEVEEPVTELIFEGPVWEYINKEDIAIIGNRNIQLSDAVIHREWMVADRLNTAAQTGIFKKAVVDEILGGGPHAEAGRDGMNAAQDRETHSGVRTLDIQEDLDKYEILEAHLEVDINNDGLNESIVVWVDAKSGKELRATYAHRVNKGGKRPFANIEFIPREGHSYAMGLLELLFPLSVELDFIHNIKIDIGMLAAMPFGFYRAATGMEAAKIRIRPGDLIPVDDPGSHVFFPNLGDRSGFFQNEEGALMQHIERLTAINDINMATLGRQGVARTATGVSALVSENSANLDIFIKRMQRGWKQALRLMFGQLQQRLPNGTEFRVTGQDGRDYFKKIDRKDIQARVDFVLEANSANSNRMIQLENAQLVLAQMMNPFFMQIGIVEPDNVFEALKDYFQALGKKDYSRFMKKSNLQSYRILTAEEELRRVLAGQHVDVTPELDHRGFIALWDKMKDDENISGIYGENNVKNADLQAEMHTAIMESMEAQAGQVQQANQQLFNGQGMGGAAAPGQAPLLPNLGMNSYNDYQIGRANLNQQASASGQMVPGMSVGSEG